MSAQLIENTIKPWENLVANSINLQGAAVGPYPTGPAFTMPAGAALGDVLTSSALGVGTWQPNAALTGGVTTNNQTFAQVGTGPATVAAGQPITYGTVVGPANPNIVASTAVIAPFTASGTVITLVKAGTYMVSFQANCQLDAGVVLYYGSSLPAMAPLTYSMVGAQTATSSRSVTVPVYATANSSLACCAAAGNGAAMNPYANSSTTNASATQLMIVQIA